MLPSSLAAEQFRHYPPEAQAIAVAHLPLFSRLPLGFLPGLLQELIEYDYKFPAERLALDRELAFLSTRSSTELDALFAGFQQLGMGAMQSSVTWVQQPLTFNEQFSAHLWSTHQMDAFQAAAAAYGNRLQAAVPPQAPSQPRMSIAVLGAGVSTAPASLFARLRPHGTLFTNVEPAGGIQVLLEAVRSRAETFPQPYAHWYVDGGEALAGAASLTCVSYAALQPVRGALLGEIEREASRPGAGPESLRNHIAALQPDQLGLRGHPVLDRFQMKLLTEGSGTQIYSTTFAQWTAREVLRRAEPLSLLVRFAPRQRQRPMNELLSNRPATIELDPEASLVDADMAAYYQWINQQRLSGHEQGVFLAWFEGHRQALAISPTLPRGAESKTPLDMRALLALASGA